MDRGVPGVQLVPWDLEALPALPALRHPGVPGHPEHPAGRKDTDQRVKTLLMQVMKKRTCKRRVSRWKEEEQKNKQMQSSRKVEEVP